METAAEAVALEVKRHLRATPAQVFDAWTRSDSLGSWFAPSADMTTIVHHLDARAGGSYRIEMRAADGTPNITRGTYQTFDPPHHLAFTWTWEGKEEEESLVDITLTPTDNGCDLVLRHTRFATSKSRDGHLRGWEGCLTRLAHHFTTNHTH